MEASTIAQVNEPVAIQKSQHSPEQWVDEHADLMFRIAFTRVGDSNVAEDLVQEAFLAAWKSRDSFDGRSQIQTWLVAILKRKVVDYFRKQGRSPLLVHDLKQDDEFFDTDGLWHKRIEKCSLPPNSTVEKAEFWEIVNACVSALPGPLAQSFFLRELEAKPAADTCQELGISRKNLSVRLHRARLLMRRCLESRWLLGKKQ